jgi:hypothetical protein
MVHNFALHFWKLSDLVYRTVIHDFISFLIDFKSRSCPSARCSSADNDICKNTGYSTESLFRLTIC